MLCSVRRGRRVRTVGVFHLVRRGRRVRVAQTHRREAMFSLSGFCSVRPGRADASAQNPAGGRVSLGPTGSRRRIGVKPRRSSRDFARSDASAQNPAGGHVSLREAMSLNIEFNFKTQGHIPGRPTQCVNQRWFGTRMASFPDNIKL